MELCVCVFKLDENSMYLRWSYFVCGVVVDVDASAVDDGFVAAVAGQPSVSLISTKTRGTVEK